MKANTAELKKLIDIHFNGNKSAFARELNVERSQISTLLNHNNCAGAKVFGAIIQYCLKNQIDFQRYIIFD